MDRKVFISYSVKDEKLMELFRRLLEDLGYKVDPLNYGTDAALINKEAELIRKSDGFVGLLTEQEGREFSPAVITEIGIASGLEKPMQLFVFDDLDVTKLAIVGKHTPAKISIHDRLDDGEIALDSKNIRGVFRALYEFDDRMDNIYEHKSGDTDRFIYKSFEISQKISGPKTLHLANTVTAVPMKRLATHTHEGTLFCDTGQKDGVKLLEGNWKFKLFHPGNTVPKVRIVQNDRTFFRFNFDLSPPLEAGTELGYGYSRDPENFFPYTQEELESAFEEKLIKHKLMIDNGMIGQDFRVTRKTEKLIINMEFPPGYPIMEWGAFACDKNLDVSDPTETERAMQASDLVYQQLAEVHTLKMELEKPTKDFTYFLFYKPPPKHAISGEI